MTQPKLTVDVLTLFPRMFEGPFSESIIGRAQEAGFIKLTVHNLRDWSIDKKHAKVDDRPFGGGAGMLIQAEPVFLALKQLRRKLQKPWVVFLTPQGERFSQKKAQQLSRRKKLILVCGHYEGVDERVMPLMDEQLSIGDFVLTGGEIPALALIDSTVRLVPGVVGDAESLIHESFGDRRLEYPQFTRPRVWRGKQVPEVLLSGHHAKIQAWRQKQSELRTRERRPDLLKPVSNIKKNR